MSSIKLCVNDTGFLLYVVHMVQIVQICGK